MTLPYPSNFKVGNAKGAGDCFFDSVAQGLRQLRPKRQYGVRSLRKKCAEFVKERQYTDTWICRALEYEKQNVDSYVKNVIHCAEDFNEVATIPVGMKSAMWGRPEIEGRIICNVFDVHLHVIGKYMIENTVVWTHQIVDKNGSKSVNNIDYESNGMIHILNKGAEHFEALLGTNGVKSSRVKKHYVLEGRVKEYEPNPNKQASTKESKPVESAKAETAGTPLELTQNLLQDNNCNVTKQENQSSAIPNLNHSASNSATAVDYDAQNQMHVIKVNEEGTLFKPLLKINMKLKSYNNSEHLVQSDNSIETENPESLALNSEGVPTCSDMQCSEQDMIQNDETTLSEAGTKDHLNSAVSSPSNERESCDERGKTNNVISETKKYTKTKGTAKSNQSGIDYEEKLFMLLLLRGLTNTVSFHLGNNVDDAKKFDDVVFKYKNIQNGKGQSQTVFMQLKHKGNDKHGIGHHILLSEKGDYSLKVYFDAYIEIREKIVKQKQAPIFNGDIEDCYFILYTTNSLQPDVLRDETIHDADVLKMVSSGRGSIVQFKTNEKIIEKLCVGGTPQESSVAEFLQRFYLFVDQPKLGKLINNIILEMDRVYGNNWDAKSVFNEAQVLIPKLCQKAIYISEINQIFVDAVHFIQVNEMKHKKIGIQFANEKIKELIGLVKNLVVINIFADGAKLLGSALVFQAFDSNSEWNIESKKSIFMELDKLMSIKKQVLLAFQSKDLLVIEGSFGKEHINLLRELSAIMLGDDKKKVILITDCDVSKTIFKSYCTMKMEFKDLTAESQDLILERKVNFQGKPVALRNLIDRDDFAGDIISLKTLMQLYNDERFVISNEPLRFHKMDAAHAKFPLKLEPNNFVHIARKCFNRNALFLVFQTQENEVANLLNQNPEDAEFVNKSICNNDIVIDTNKDKEYMLEKFEQLCDRKDKIVYWFKLAHGHFELEKLYDPNFYTQRKFNFPGKIRIAMDVLSQRNLNQSGTLMCSSGKQHLMQMFEIYKANSIRHFETQCQKGRIIFESSADRAQSIFDYLCDINNLVFWLKIDRTKNFAVHLSKDTFQKLFSSDEGNVEPDVLIKEEQSDTIFIFAENDNKQRVQSVIETCLTRKQERFHENCISGNIVFRDENIAEGSGKNNEPEHCFEIDGDDLVWTHSNGSLEGLHDYVSIHYDIFNEEENMSEDAECKCVILAADPGMGKSSTLTSLSERMKDTNWVICIKFKECTDAINALPSDTTKHVVNFERICHFFSEVGGTGTGMQHDLAKQLFMHKLKQETCENKPILILFDAFDEISDEQQKKITPLLMFLNFQTSARLWITTRETRTQELENALATSATRFQELDKKQQEDFLYNYWRVRVNVLPIHNADDNLTKCARKLLEYFKCSPGVTMLQLIPYQLQILAEGFQNVAERNTDPKFDRINTIINIYKRFMDGRYSVYFSEKTGLVKHSHYVRNRLLKSLNKDHQYLGFHEAIPNETILSYRHKFPSKKEERDLISVGIIQSSGKEGNIYFIHKSFAEYFAADLLVENLQKKTKCPIKYQSTKQLFQSHEMLLEANTVIRHFVDRMLCKHSPVHLAAFEGDILKFIAALKDNKDGMEVVDELGRTPLHLAVQERNEDIIDYLTSEGCNDSILDIFSKNPFDYLAPN